MAAYGRLVRAPYRAIPDKNGTIQLVPLIRVRVAKKHAQPTRYFEAMVDSGAADCIFHELVAASIGIKLEAGSKEQRMGIGGAQEVWVHPIQLYVGTEIIDINAAFSAGLPIAGLLGLSGSSSISE